MWYEMGNIGNFFGEWKSDDFPIKSMNFVKNILGIFIISISMHHKKKINNSLECDDFPLLAMP